MNMCNCTGPNMGEPVCPCKMKNLRKVDGRWIEVIDHGPVQDVPEDYVEIYKQWKKKGWGSITQKEIPCAFDQFRDYDGSLGLVCNCPKCSITC